MQDGTGSSRSLRHRATTPVYRLIVLWLCAAACGRAIAGDEAPVWPPVTSLHDHVAYLSGLPSRVAGYPGAAEAARYIRRQLEATAPDWIAQQRFPIASPIDDGAHVTIEDTGQEIELHALWPNLARTPGTPPAGLSGALIDGRDGQTRHYDGKALRGAIILLDFNCAARWYEAFVLGARAVIFIAPEEMTRHDASQKFLDVPLEMPRYYVSQAQGAVLREQARRSPAATICSGMSWRTGIGHNVLAFYEGRDPTVRHEVVAVEAYYDSTSVVPALSPGAQQAASVAALLGFAERLGRQRPRRSVLLIASDAHFNALSGVRHATAALAEAQVPAGPGAAPDERRANNRILKRIAAAQRQIGREQEKLGTLDSRGAALAGKLQQRSNRDAARDFRELVMRDVGEINRRLWELRLDGGTPTGAGQLEDRKKTLIEVVGLFERLRQRTAYRDLSKAARAEFEHAATRVRTVLAARVASLRRRKQFDEDAAGLAHRLAQRRLGLFVGLDLSTADHQFGLFTDSAFYALGAAGGTTSLSRAYSGLAKHLAETADGASPRATVYVDTVNARQGRQPQSYLPAAMAFDSEAAAACGYYGITFATIDDARTRFDTPLDTLANYTPANLQAQCLVLWPLLYELCNDPKLYDRIRSTDVPTTSLCTLDGDTRELAGAGKTVPDDPVPGAIVFARTANKTLCGVKPTLVAVSDAYGYYRFPNVRRLGGYTVDAYTIDGRTGRITRARDEGETGKRFATTFAETTPRQTVPIVLFPCAAMGVPEIIDQRFFSPMRELRVLDARTEAAPIAFGKSVPMGGSDTGFIEPGAVVFARRGARVKLTFGASVAGPRMVLLNSSTTVPHGVGYRVDRWPLIPNVMYRCARDQWLLDDLRLRRLEDKQIRNARVAALHGLAAAELELAQQALAERRTEQFLTHARNAVSLESRAYPEVTATGNDTVKGVVFYLALLFPFAFFAERLLFGFRRLETRAACVLLIFLAVFLILRLVHPAFGIIHSPIVILLAFFVFVLSSIVTSILYGRFQTELESVRRRSVQFRQVDVRRASALSLAITLGISNMRRRKLRTGLTVVSIVLVCFTMISMTSVVQTLRYTTVSLDRAAPYDGFLVHLPSWNALSPQTHQALRSFFAGQANVRPRAWLLPDNPGATPITKLSFSANGRRQSYRLGGGLIGVSVEETLLAERSGVLLAGRWFTPSDGRACVVPRDVADAFGIDSGDLGTARIVVLGVPLTVIGVFDPDKVDALRDLDGEPITPVNFLSASAERRRRGQQPPTVEQQSQQVKEPEEKFVHLLARNFVFAPFEQVRALGGGIYSISVEMRDGAVKNVAESLVRRMGLLFYMGSDGKCFLVGSGGGMSVKGLERMLLPIGIACLIVLNTMLGALFERKGEIAIESALGLAPSHIAALFVAEACVLAVMGAVLGYLMGQATAAVAYRFAPGMELNYSAFSVVMVSLLAMGMVVLPTIDPAAIASRLSAPAVKRRWEVPASENDEIPLLLPFTYRPAEAKAITGYLYDFYASHAESTAGSFCTEHTRLAPIDTERGLGYALAFDASLSPYDMGVSQYVELYTVPSAGGREHEMYLFLARQSGTVTSWERLARSFIDELRKRLLAWRTATEDERDEYARRADAAMGEARRHAVP